MNDNILTSRWSFGWYRNADGKKDQSVTEFLDTCDRLGDILFRSIMFSFSTSVYDSTDQLKLRSDESHPINYLLDIRDSLLEEIHLLRRPGILENDSCRFPCLVDKTNILESKQDILDTALYLIMDNNTVEKNGLKADAKFVDYFDYGLASGFLKEYLKFKIVSRSNSNNTEAFISLPFALPIMYRQGYDLFVDFECSCEGVLSYRTKDIICQGNSFTFIKHTAVPRMEIDGYLYLLSMYSISPDIDDVSVANLMFSFKSLVETNNVCINGIPADLLCEDGISKINKKLSCGLLYTFLQFIVYKYDTEQCELGKRTTAILSTINTDNKDASFVISSLLNTESSTESILDKSSTLYVPSLDPSSCLYTPYKNPWVSNESELLNENELGGENLPKEQNPEEKEEPSEDETQEKTEPTIKQVMVKVNKDNILFKLDTLADSSLKSFLYRKEVYYTCKSVLDNPPDEMSEESKTFLKRFLLYWLYIVDVQTVKEVFSRFIQLVPIGSED